MDRCFGFDTAVQEAQRALMAAKIEASSADNGIGLVKLMGRSSGFIAMQARPSRRRSSLVRAGPVATSVTTTTCLRAKRSRAIPRSPVSRPQPACTCMPRHGFRSKRELASCSRSRVVCPKHVCRIASRRIRPAAVVPVRMPCPRLRSSLV